MKKLLLFFYFISFFSFGQQAYYNDVNLTLTGIPLKDELAQKITSTHTKTLSYEQAREALKIVDLVPGQGDDVYLLYGFTNNTCPTNTGDDHRTRDKAYFGGGATCEWNREHTYPKSLGTPDLGETGPGADAHHLRASDVSRNGYRGNLRFSSGSGNSGTSGSGWYPGDEWKGDVARIMMYMYLRYGNQCLPSGVAIGTTNAVDSNMINLLLDWNAQDPVSTYEDYRNTYLSNASNTYGQGNRNPFIDNPNLATKIWGGTPAEDRWNTTPDTEVPSAPTNLAASNITNTAVDLNWTASTDNIGVTLYHIFKDGSLYTTSTTNSKTVTGLTQNTQYDFTVFAKDAAGNTSNVSNTKTVTTTNIIDNMPPSAITDVAASNISSTGLNLSWSVPNDNVGVVSYDVYKGLILLANVTTNAYAVSGLTPETTYNFTVYAKDAAGNISLVSNTEMATTIAAPTGAAELFISEYVEGSGFNKAIEIANFTGVDVNLSAYSLARQPSGSGAWEPNPLYQLSGTLTNGDVFVIINSDALDTNLQNQKDDAVPNTAPMTFNGDDPVGLFKNGNLIDVVGTYNGATGNFGQNITLRRKPSVTSPRTDYTVSEWDTYGTNVTDGIGSHTTTLSTIDFIHNLFNVYPNPAINNRVTIRLNNTIELSKIEFYNTLGQLIITKNNPKLTNSSIEIDHIPNGMYIVKIQSENAFSTKRLIVN